MTALKKLDYRRLFHNRETRLMYAEIKLKAANDEIERLKKEIKRIKEGSKYTYIHEAWQYPEEQSIQRK